MLHHAVAHEPVAVRRNETAGTTTVSEEALKETGYALIRFLNNLSIFF
jgi:hypothetical protein